MRLSGNLEKRPDPLSLPSYRPRSPEPSKAVRQSMKDCQNHGKMSGVKWGDGEGGVRRRGIPTHAHSACSQIPATHPGNRVLNQYLLCLCVLPRSCGPTNLSRLFPVHGSCHFCSSLPTGSDLVQGACPRALGPAPEINTRGSAWKPTPGPPSPDLGGYWGCGCSRDFKLPLHSFLPGRNAPSQLLRD